MKRIRLFALCTLFAFTSAFLWAQEEEAKEEKAGYQFTVIKELPSTPVKNQYKSGTCWSFSGVALLETELLRMGKDTFDLSEMFIVRKSYEEKGKKYLRFHGKTNFAGGGGFSDVIMTLEEYGAIPDEVYSGLVIGEDKHVHGEMDEVLNAYVDAVLKNKNRKLSPVWMTGFNGILDAYLGEVPETFTYKGIEYTPESYAAVLGLNPEDYIELGSYTHHPFYKPFILEIPDNWMHSLVYNLPLDELMEIFDYAINNGYSVAWAADISERGFSWKDGVAIVPEDNIEDLSGTEKERWEKLTEKERNKALYSFEEPGPEKKITQEMRQEAFDNFETTDDHGMLITGIAKDQNDNKYYIVKNSWGTTDHKYDGYFYTSEPFTRYKTISIMVHKDAIPKHLRKKLGL
ncbi:MAG: C1 family peptidase [Bacteroidetes bacterium]|nr:C1 family peptidase [Bacteroidota bacterium]